VELFTGYHGELRYALQRGRPWGTVKYYEAEKYEFEYVQAVMSQCCKQWPGRRWRILLMPFNVLADET
jgi:hypothetical protein